jgi:diguanylate cyclase
MNFDLIKEYKELSLFLMKTLQDTVSGGAAVRSVESLREYLQQAAGDAGQIRRVHRQLKDLLLKEEPVDVGQLLATVKHLKQELLAQSGLEVDLRRLVEDFKTLVEVALAQFESLTCGESHLELIHECRTELKTITTPEQLAGYGEKFRRVCSGSRFPVEEIVQERDELKKIISILGDSISSLLTSSGEFDSGLEECISRLQQAHSLTEVQEIRNLLLEQTLSLQERTRRMASEMHQARVQVDDANRKIESLKKQMEKIKKEVVIDPLTRAYNRRALDERLGQELQAFQRYGQPVSMVMVDIDHFKKINDNYGHRTGDGVLRILSEVMKKEIREVDFLARYGGEEFVIILPHIVYALALEVAGRICTKVAASRFAFKGEPFTVTISAGVGTLREKDTIESFINRVDQALYQAKRQGRNRVVGAEDLPVSG